MKVSTKVNKDSDAVKTILELDFNDTTREELVELATKSAIIMCQAEWRVDGIPATATVNVHELCNRERKARVKLTPEQTFERMSPSDQDEFLNRLQAMQAARLAG